MDNRYCGKDYWQRKGIDFRKCYERIKTYILEQEKVWISDFCKSIHKAFDVGLVDNHLAFASPLTGLLRFSRQYCAYFADLLVEKEEDYYIVIESRTEAAAVGDKIGSTEALYKTLAPAGKERYLAGIRSYKPVHHMKLMVNGRVAEAPLHRCRANEEMDFVSIGRQYAGCKRLILNYLSNEGGYNRMTREFIKGLNGYVHCPEYSWKLISPVTEEKDCRREWVKLSDPSPYARERGVYDGTCIMLVNSNTASAGETAVLYGKSLRNSEFA